ncbi:MAG: pantetheine-phosphate adenylyltransferase [Puniceicoccaceae bacterium]|nr:MAG: pantetheine-phosphate adenylyltransferase [Puniceicoccaceae bacterium]
MAPVDAESAPPKLSHPSTCIYPGTFDPLTYGHLDVLRRVARLFDRVVLAVANNRRKGPLFDAGERLRLVQENLGGFANVEAVRFDGLLVDFARRHQAAAIVRGLRALTDFEYEFQMALMNRHLEGGIETIFVMTKDTFSYTSSTMIKQIASLGGEISDFVPPNVAAALKAKLAAAPRET